MSETIQQLEMLHGLREKTRDDHRTEYARISEEVRQIQTYIENLKNTVIATQDEIRMRQKELNHEIAKRQWFSEFKKAKKVEIKELEIEIQNAKNAFQNAKKLQEEKREVLIKSEANLKAVEKLIEIETQKRRKLALKKEEDNADEIAQSRWGKR